MMKNKAFLEVINLWTYLISEGLMLPWNTGNIWDLQNFIMI